jgi:hypothetical protein
MTPEQQKSINKFLCEKGKGEHYHVGIVYPSGQVSNYKCACMGHQSLEPLDYINPNYFSDSEYLPFLRWCYNQNWWGEFVDDIIPKVHWDTLTFVLNPNKMLPAVAKWHGWDN